MRTHLNVAECALKAIKGTDIFTRCYGMFLPAQDAPIVLGSTGKVVNSTSADRVVRQAAVLLQWLHCLSDAMRNDE